MYKSLSLPLLVTLFMHGLILAVVLINAPESTPIVKRAVTKYIKAELVTLEKPKVKKRAPKRQPTPKANSKVKQRALAEKKKVAQKKVKQEQAKLQLKQQQLEKQQQEQHRLDKQRRLREQFEQEIADAIERENVLVQAETDAQLANSYIALITEVIQNNWSRPPSARNNMETELALRLVPTGQVVSVEVVRSSGNAAFDRSAESAVLKAERFPELQQVPARIFEQYFRRLRLKFRPEDLRL
ncbi:MAG: cell envelope integrity protein TolA [Pseudomonadales bacterium]